MDSRFLAFLFLVCALIVCWKSGPVFAAWLRARREQAPVSLLRVWVMFLQNLPLGEVIDAHVRATRAGVRIPVTELAAHARAGGDIRAVVQAYLETLRAGTPIEFSRVCEIELADATEEELR